MGIKTIVSRAPTRIDLAGGTVDIWPIFLFLQQPVTINLGIDLYAEARVDLAAGDGVVLRSEDQNKELKISWKDLRDGNLQPPPQLELHYKLLRYFAALAPTRGGSLTLSTRAKSPSGAGLGGSSTLSIAMIGALATWAREGQVVDPVREGEKFIEIVRDVETTVIQVPAGMQDYYGAMFGGLQAIRW
ncbi:MAG: GHMP family kinase ATP-binding protein, partial [Bdellovibrionota bacterium]